MLTSRPALLQAALNHLQRGELPEAEGTLTQLLGIQPRDFDALHLLGIAQAMQGRQPQAIQTFRKALPLGQKHAALQFNLAKALSETGQHAEALPHHHQAVELAPENPEAWVGYGHALVELERLADALAALDRAITLQPDMPVFHFNRGVILDAMDQLEQAQQSYARALELQPDYAQAWNNQGATLAALERPLEALACYSQALRHQPAYAAAYNNMGSAYRALGRDREAKDCYEQALTLDPGHVDAHLTLSHLLLSSGDFAAGWRQFEYRWQTQDAPPRPLQTRRPRWQGAASDQPLLLWGEQGLGDQILYASVLPDLSALPRRKTVALDKRLVPLFARSMPAFEFLDLNTVSDALDFAEQLPMGSLPGHFRPNLQSFASARAPFLHADPVRTAALREKIARPGKRVCGISWSSNRKSIGQQKSIDLEQLLAPLASESLHFVDLQYGDTAAERQALQDRHGVSVQHVDEVDNFHDIDGLAALIEACDVVLTTSNSTAHLAGALGKTTLLLLPLGKGKLWYWSLIDGRIPWYPSIQAYGQAVIGDWQAPLQQMKAALETR